MIEIQGLNSHYKSRQVLFDVRLTIPHNRITAIMGVSGCGKTTLLRHLIGLKPSRVGEIMVEGEDLGRFSEESLRKYRRRIGVLFQNGALFNSMSVLENIAVPLRVHSRLPSETVRIIALMKLSMVGLADFSGYMPSQLSGGMRKRAGLARALAMDPEILFVDEPSSGLDPITAAGLDDLILALRGTIGTTIVVITHELESAFKIGDQIIVMDQGRVMISGTPEEIHGSENPRVMQFLRRQADERSNDSKSYLSRLFRD
jgi:phospholipid/cholesterol/gamma-HCH transport system ATP-binding protein